MKVRPCVVCIAIYPDSDDLSHVDQIGVLDVGVQRQQSIDGGSIFVGDDAERFAALDRVCLG